MAREGGRDRGVYERREKCRVCNGARCPGCRRKARPCPSCPCSICTACAGRGTVGTGVWWVAFSDGRRYVRRSVGRSKRGALEVYRKLKTEVREGRFFPKPAPSPPVVTLASAIETYMVESRATKRSWRDDMHYAAVWTASFGKRALAAVTPTDLEEWRRRQTEVSVATVNRHLAFLRRVFSVAVRDGLCVQNPVSQIRLASENNARIRWLSIEEEDRLRAHCSAELWLQIELAVLTGLRQSEQFMLQWSSVDFATGVITIPRSKSGSVRRVPMSDRVTQILAGMRSRGSSSWVYPAYANDGGNGVLNDAGGSRLWREFNRARKGAGLVDLHWHDLRHTFASRLVMSGVDLYTVQKLLGHRTIEMTQRYAHLAPDHLRSAVQTLAAKSEPTQKPTHALVDIEQSSMDAPQCESLQ